MTGALRVPTLGWHVRSATIVALLALPVGLRSAVDFGSNAAHGWSGAASILIMLLAGSLALVVLGLRLDDSFPASPPARSGLRMLVPTLLVVWACAWTANRGIFAATEWRGLIAPGVGAFLVGGVWFAGRLLPNEIEELPPPPPTAAQQSVAGPTPPIDVLADRPATAHRVASSLVAAGWIPFGLVMLYGLNFCPNEGEGTWMAAWTLSFVVVQILGNAVGGVVLDRRFGHLGGLLA